MKKITWLSLLVCILGISIAQGSLKGDESTQAYFSELDDSELKKVGKWIPVAYLVCYRQSAAVAFTATLESCPVFSGVIKTLFRIPFSKEIIDATDPVEARQFSSSLFGALAMPADLIKGVFSSEDAEDIQQFAHTYNNYYLTRKVSKRLFDIEQDKKNFCLNLLRTVDFYKKELNSRGLE